MATDNLTAEILRTMLKYSPATGEFSWLTKAALRTVIGSRAGTISQGYIRIKICGHLYPAHRLAWLYVYGEWPAKMIDHIDGDGLNNKISNLRQATQAENLQNLGVRSSNKSGYPGVSWSTWHRKWSADISVNGRNKNLGRYENIEEAAEAYRTAKLTEHHFQPRIRGL